MHMMKSSRISVGSQALRCGFSQVPVFLSLLAVIIASDALGAEKKGGSDIVQTLNKAQGMLRQLSQEKAELEAKTASLEKELADTKKTLEDRGKQLETRAKELQVMQVEVKHKADTLAALEKNNGILKNNNEILKTHLEKLKQQYGEQNQALQEQSRRLSAELTASQQDNALLVRAVKERAEWIDKCTKRNGQLIKTNKDILDHVRDKSFWESLQEAEPLTGIASVAKENKLEEYRYKLNDLRVTPWNDQ
jgi:septal ring factor EnvC (AmiA/AmiB activator)